VTAGSARPAFPFLRRLGDRLVRGRVGRLQIRLDEFKLVNLAPIINTPKAIDLFAARRKWTS
jgi:hypothetical protein